MANEAILRTETEIPVGMVVADGAGIEKGTILKMTDGNVAVASSGSGDVFAGIAAQEKIANNGRTSLAVYKRGKFNLAVASGASVTTGELVSTSGANVIKTATEAEIAAGKAIGKTLEDGVGDNSETVEVMVGYL